MIFVKTIYYILSGIVFFYSLYFTIMGFCGVCHQRKKNINSSSFKYHNFAIIIPARNEEKVIGNLIESLKKQNYPKNCYTIYVAINNCTDKTKTKALSRGAKIIDCIGKFSNKGAVLEYAFANLNEDKSIDAYVVFDADNLVDSNFLMYMNKSLNNGYRIGQSNHQGKNSSDNWLTSSYAIFYLIQNEFFNRSRVNLGASSSINGTGFMIKKSFIDEYGFKTYTFTEDLEFAGQCALKKEKIDYVENAITYDEHANNFKTSWKQRKRWSTGVNSCLTRYSGKLFTHFFKTGNLASLDMALVYLGPLMQLVDFLKFILFVVIACFSTTTLLTFLIPLGLMITLYLVSIILEIYVILREKKKIKSLLSGMILFSFFIISWIPINLVILFKRQKIWDPIEHNRDIRTKDLNKRH